VNVVYTALQAARIQVDIHDQSGAWYGQGFVNVNAGSSTISFAVTINVAGNLLPAIPLRLKYWILKQTDVTQSQPWLFAQSELFVDGINLDWAISTISPPSSTIQTAPGNFNVAVGYRSLVAGKIVVDILYPNGGTTTWYGGGSILVNAGSGTVNVPVNIPSAIPGGISLQLKGWIIKASDAGLAEPWNAAQYEKFVATSTASSPTPSPTPAPTPSPTPAPTGPTPAPTPAPPTTPNPGGPGLYSTSAGTTYSRFTQFVNALTNKPVAGSNARAVHASGGAAGDQTVISEGQGYGLFIGGATTAILGSSNANFAYARDTTYEMFLAWKRMCQQSAGGPSCQSVGYCSGSPCLPHWKWDSSIGSNAWGTGSAPDGDEDAILGMILLAYATKNNKPTWWNEVAVWAYQSAKQFYDYSTVASSDGTHRIVKLGACWGGWDCNNPSYHAPAAYRVMRDFMKNYGPSLGMGTEGASYVSKWNTVIDTSYKVLLADQCDNTGLTTNWYVPNQGNPAAVGSTGCGGSGTPSDQYGAEAARGSWRVALDWIWYGDEDTVRPAAYLTPLAQHVSSRYTSGNNFNNLSPGCLVGSVFGDWLNNAFIYGPTFSALTFPSGAANQQAALNAAAGRLAAAGSINDYYGGSWVAISVATINGDLASLKALVRSGAPAKRNVMEEAVVPEISAESLSVGVTAGIAVASVVAVLAVVATVRYYGKKPTIA